MNEEQKQEPNIITDFLNNSELTSTIVDVTIVFLAAFIAILRSKKELTDHLKLIIKFQSQEQKYSQLLIKEICNTLNKMQALSGCDRIILGLFDEDDSHRITFNAKYEFSNAGIASILDKINNIPIWKLSPEIELMRECPDKLMFAYAPDEQIIVNDKIKKMEEKCKNHLIKIGVVCTYEILLSNGEDKGIIGIQYLSKDTYKLSAFEHNRTAILKLRDYLTALLN